MQQAVVDRFEEDMAVILVGEEERQLVVERKLLPPGVREGDWLQVTVQDGKLVEVRVDPEARASAEARIAEKMARLRRGQQLEGQ